MTQRSAKSGFKNTKDNDLSSIAATVLAAMGSNPHFTTPNPPLTELETALEDFRVKLEAAQRKGSPEEISLKNESRPVLIWVLKQLAQYVNNIAGGKLSVILGSGFPVTEAREKGSSPAVPERVKLRDCYPAATHNGTANTSCRPQKNRLK